MLKVEMFALHDSLVEVENIINDWLTDNPDIEIKHILQSSESEATIISIWYEDKS